jgi:glyoxylase-like metal-dependent hydrolase (beta-lactamase superfamily II)
MSTTFFVRWPSIAVLSLGAWLAVGQNQQTPPQNKLEKVKDDLYVISGDGGNTTVFLTDEGVVLVDDKFERDYDDIVAKVKSLTEKPIKYVFNTHQHTDHTGGNQKMLATADTIASSKARTNMMERKMPGVPRLSFTHELTLTLGGKEVVARHFGRGHTDGDSMVYFPADKVAAIGDKFSTGTFGVYIDYKSGGTTAEWAKTLEEALQWDFDTVIPGHGPFAKREDVVKSRNDVEAMRKRISAMIRGGKTKDEVTKVLIGEFGWNPNGLGIRNSVDGLMNE